MTDGTIISFDSINAYYDLALKEYRLDLIEKAAENSCVKHIFIKGNPVDKVLIDEMFANYQPDVVVILVVQAGVRCPIDHSDAYIESNIIGFYNILEACRHSYDNATRVWSVWCMSLPALYMGAIRRCLSALKTRWTIPFPCMQLPKKGTSCWLIAIPSRTTFHLLG